MPNSSPLTAGSTLEKRYRIVRELGHGGFGRTYLAEDLNRYKEYCVLKEFAPQVHTSHEVRKAGELFEREAGVLYKLQHPQIPRFRELLRLNVVGKESLFLVQDYVEGQTYSDLLKSRLKKGQRFSEAEVIQLLLEILPVLQHIHSLGVVHRDISPENLIQRSSDKLPVLIDFGAVKQAATTAISQFTGLPVLTLLGKEGYAPQEQIQQGKAFPCTDLYSLAVTVLVLLIGKEPKALYDSAKVEWHWRREITVNPTLASVLDKMLAHRPRDRFQTAREVLDILQSANFNQSPLANPNPSPAANANPWAVASQTISRMQTVNFIGHRFSRNHHAAANVGVTNFHQSANNDFWANFQAVLSSMMLVLVLGVGAWGLAKAWTFTTSGFSQLQPPRVSLPSISLPSISLPIPTSLPIPSSSPVLSQAEIAELDAIVQRLKRLGISEPNFYRRVDELFYARNPQLKGRSLTNKAEDAKLRQRWRDIAEDLLNRLERSEGF